MDRLRGVVLTSSWIWAEDCAALQEAQCNIMRQKAFLLPAWFSYQGFSCGIKIMSCNLDRMIGLATADGFRPPSNFLAWQYLSYLGVGLIFSRGIIQGPRLFLGNRKVTSTRPGLIASTGWSWLVRLRAEKGWDGGTGQGELAPNENRSEPMICFFTPSSQEYHKYRAIRAENETDEYIELSCSLADMKTALSANFAWNTGWRAHISRTLILRRSAHSAQEYV
jgi:hypothetical protein